MLQAVPRTTVFVSYSHKDAYWLERLRVHLSPLVDDGRVELWDDTQIRAGDRWAEKINGQLVIARVAVLLVSADFLASRFVRTAEIPPLLAAAERAGTVILPIIVGPSLFEDTPGLSRFQAINSPRRPLKSLDENGQDEVLRAAARRIGGMLAELPRRRQEHLVGDDPTVLQASSEQSASRWRTDLEPMPRAPSSRSRWLIAGAAVSSIGLTGWGVGTFWSGRDALESARHSVRVENRATQPNEATALLAPSVQSEPPDKKKVDPPEPKSPPPEPKAKLTLPTSASASKSEVASVEKKAAAKLAANPKRATKHTTATADDNATDGTAANGIPADGDVLPPAKVVTVDGVQEEHEFDTQGRLVKRKRGAEAISISYNEGATLPARIVNTAPDLSSTWTEFKYDPERRLIFAKNSSKRGVQLFYGPDGHISSLVNENKRRINLTYDSKGRLASITDPQVGMTSTFEAQAGAVEIIYPALDFQCAAGRTIARQVIANLQRLLDILDPAVPTRWGSTAVGSEIQIMRQVCLLASRWSRTPA